jgi:hypothetical protein
MMNTRRFQGVFKKWVITKASFLTLLLLALLGYGVAGNDRDSDRRKQ